MQLNLTRFLHNQTLIKNILRFGVRKMASTSKLSYIDNAPGDPVDLFTALLKAMPSHGSIEINLATVDKEFGALNRTVVYRGLVNNDVAFVTERNSRKYENIIENPNVSATLVLRSIEYEGTEAYWQVRMFGKAVELDAEQITKFWDTEPVFARIRSRICECGKPIDFNQHKEMHDALLKDYESGKDKLEQTKTFTAFRIVPKVWDFYKSESYSIADRVQYRRTSTEGNTWDIIHVAA